MKARLPRWMKAASARPARHRGACPASRACRARGAIVKPLTVIGFLGSTLDASKSGPSRWNKWRPSVGVTMHEDLRVDRFPPNPRQPAQPTRRLCRRGHRLGLARDIGRAASCSTSRIRGTSRKSTASCSTSPAPRRSIPRWRIISSTSPPARMVAQICLFLLTEARLIYQGGCCKRSPSADRSTRRGRGTRSTSICRATTASRRASPSRARKARLS